MAVATDAAGIRERLNLKRSEEKLAITVLSGGPGGEREVSLQSGQCVAAALRSRGHDVQVEDIAPDQLSGLAREVDCVFVALHGQFGEDGDVQQILERRRLAYCGSGPEACAAAMNKATAKERFIAGDVPTARFTVATRDNIRQAMAAWNLPVVVKPVSGGSSLSCYIIRDVTQFRPAIEMVIETHGACIVERYVPGLEIAIGVLGDQALPPIEIRTSRPFYDYEAKYVDDTTEYRFDVDLPESLLQSLGELSVQAHNLLGCRDFSRVDWRVDNNTMRPFALEVNVIPGMTSHSLLPKAAARVGIDMPELCQMLVEMAIRRKFTT
ncbi:MAG: D-alanine--D-alanine ligase [Phycisphaerales bacterium]|nr:D-alanine--D-alanine ligase [Phycisphaerales bacterium]MCB9858684.1 D-alanine--D-alanine ligase [Phycisphaerales bacterium]MCB9864460.1 D-alanine--D-alanine ligase [Phycisphaerales bacterium]